MEVSQDNKGGLIAIPFIMANEIFEKVATYGLMANMIVYLTAEYHIQPAKGVSLLFIWGAVTNFLPIFGAFLSDSYLGRFRVITLGSLMSLIGMSLLWMTAVLHGAQPPDCDVAIGHCKPPSSSQLALLFFAFVMMSIGAGGIRPCSLAFGADQFRKKTKERVLQTFFNFYYASVGMSIVVAVTIIAYIQDKHGYKVGFGVPVVLMVLSTVLFVMGSPLYTKMKANKSMLSSLAQAAVASVRNRNLALPMKTTDGLYHHEDGSKIMVPSDNLRFLNKACIIGNLEPSSASPWTLSTVTKVELLKSAMRVMPIWSTGIMLAVIVSQQAFPLLQARTMNRYVGSFEIPAASFGAFGIVALTIWVLLYDRVIVPPLSKVTGRPRGLGLQQRMGIGLIVSCLAMAVSAFVESVRRGRAIEQGLEDNAKGIVAMSAMWLVPQHCLMGLAEALNIIGQIEFYYSELPKIMASVAVALFTLGMGVGNLVGSLIVEVVNRVTGSSGRVSWVASNMNKGRYDFYYWFLAMLSVLNFVYFVGCSWGYGEEGMNRVFDEAEGVKVEDPLQQTSSKTMEMHDIL